MFISWRLTNASNIAILVGDAMPFMLKVANLIEAIRSNCGGEWARGSTMVSILCPYYVALLSFYSSSVSVVFPRFFQFYLFISGCGLFRIVCFRVFIRRVGCAVHGHFVLVVQPVCTSDICHHFLPNAFFSLCFECLGRTVRLVGISSNAIISASTVITSWGQNICEVYWVCVLVLGRQIMPSLVSGVLLFPTNI